MYRYDETNAIKNPGNFYLENPSLPTYQSPLSRESMADFISQDLGDQGRRKKILKKIKDSVWGGGAVFVILEILEIYINGKVN